MFTSAESVRTCLALLTDQFLVNHSCHLDNAWTSKRQSFVMIKT